MNFDLAKILSFVICLSLVSLSSVTFSLAAESQVCADGTPCPENSGPSDEELEDSCSDEAETI